MTHYIGIALAVLILVAVAAGLWWTWRRPFVGLGLIVAGLALHNIVVMALLGLGTPNVLVRAVQGWKELFLLVLVVVATRTVISHRQGSTLGPLTPTDGIAIAFAAIVCIYFVIPPSVLGSDASLAQRLVGFRTLIVIPLLYFIGRTVRAADDRDRLTVVLLCMGAGAVVAMFGVYELFFVPTSTWLRWGINTYTSFLGFTYHGPAGLPENFFITVSIGTLVRRMVSTYVSPLGVAYTGLVLFPLGIAVMDRRVSQRIAALIAVATALVVLSMALSITRLALFAAIGEAMLLAFVLRRVWIAALIPVLIAATVTALLPYASVAPAVDKNLNPVSRSGILWTIPGNDSSGREHYDYLKSDLLVDLEHPLGLGTGASTVRYGQLVGTGESAVLGMFGDLGVVGGSLYVVLFLAAIWHGYRALKHSRAASLEDCLPLVALIGGLALIPITMTTDLWGDLSVTFLFWWSAGASATLCAERAWRPARAALGVPRRMIAGE
jgi:hypothetical protein